MKEIHQRVLLLLSGGQEQPSKLPEGPNEEAFTTGFTAQEHVNELDQCTGTGEASLRLAALIS